MKKNRINSLKEFIKISLRIFLTFAIIVCGVIAVQANSTVCSSKQYFNGVSCVICPEWTKSSVIAGQCGCTMIYSSLADEYICSASTPNTPPTQPFVSGPEYVKSGMEFSIFASTTDAQGDKVKYNINWKAGTPLQGTAPASGYVIATDNTEAGHRYTITASISVTTYNIEVSATDEKGATSGTTTKSVIVHNCSADYYFNTTSKTCSICPTGQTTNGLTGQTSWCEYYSYHSDRNQNHTDHSNLLSCRICG